MEAGSTILVIPAFNEERNLPSVLSAVRDAKLGLTEVVVVDDGSRDRTSEVARRLGACVVRHPFNLGYGSALQTGYKYALSRGAAMLVQMDADGQHDPRQAPTLLRAVRNNECDLALGSRFLEPSGYQMGVSRTIGRELFRLLARLAGLELTDPTSGFQAMNRAVLQVYATDFYPTDYPDVDVLLTAHRSGLRVREYPVTMSEGLRESSLHGGLRAFYYVYKMLLSIWATTAVSPRREEMQG